jgi:hypothetical protein
VSKESVAQSFGVPPHHEFGQQLSFWQIAASVCAAQSELPVHTLEAQVQPGALPQSVALKSCWQEP